MGPTSLIYFETHKLRSRYDLGWWGKFTMFGVRVLDLRPETAGIQPFRQTLDISPSLNSEASPPLILSGDDFLPPSEFEAGFQPTNVGLGWFRRSSLGMG